MNASTHTPTVPLSAPLSPAPALDAQALARLRELDPEGRNGVLRRVLGAYEGSLLRVLALVQEQGGKAVPDHKVLMDNAHMLKSSSASVGALSLARLCEAIETRTRATHSALPQDCENFAAELQRALAALRPLLNS